MLKLLKNKQTSKITLYYYSLLQSAEDFVFYSNNIISDNIIALQYRVIFFLEKKNYNFNHIYIICNIFPRVFVTLTFFFELFLFGKIRFFYLLLPLLLMPLMLTYIEYRLKDLYNKQSTKLDHILTIVDLMPNKYQINLCNYIELLVLNRLKVHTINFNFLITISKQHIKNQMKSYDSSKIFNYEKALNHYLPMVDTLLTHYTIYYKYIQAKSNYRLLDILIYLIYLICWLYILVVSFHTLDPLALSNLLSLLPPNNSNPFL